MLNRLPASHRRGQRFFGSPPWGGDTTTDRRSQLPDQGGLLIKQRIRSVACGIVAFLSLAIPPAPAHGAVNCAAPACHASLTRSNFLHEPVAAGNCTVCHEVIGGRHPGGGPAFGMRFPGRKLCEQCHTNPGRGKARIHRPVAAGRCLSCHDPHGGDTRYLLVTEANALCRTCHPKVGATGRAHGPVRAGRCDYCHVGHAADEPGLLSAPGNKVCFACHSGILDIVAAARSQHRPVADGRCWDCHETHSSEFRPLLRGYYPREFYAPYDARNFALCLGCHTDPGRFEYQRTSEATGFRNGDQNLHYLHVNKPVKGRVCRNCHGIHGADQKKLILSRVPGFGNWKIPVRFLPTATGATCLAGCHKPKSYDRVRPADNP